MIKRQQTYNRLTNILISIPVSGVLYTVISVNHDLGNGVVSGKYFWFYTSMALLSVIAIPIAIIKRKDRRFRFFT